MSRMASPTRLPRLAWLGGCLALMAGCVHQPPPLYHWGNFQRLQYDTLLTAGNPPLEQVALMEAQAEKARAAGTALPPGFRAHLGMLKLSAGDVDRARDLWQAEKSAFPESTPYMDQLLKRLNASPSKNSKDKSAS
jgi:hypothetical protein